ncbi:hypothetical protein KBY82_05235 [Cyanobium sp. AMD-g]|jgi:hypothetical protein|uniref:hypothetical protein n=1 Tax=Cyanobium sp. AMD-g TaxID=2823699 RepID=UPI0020CED2ED|nr:hypothetical protein [Cyanobium sp. AMD-g]MBW4530647.1 hypothetical protein [Aphanothece saxicola GSE-SYN-MK-01-06B]MCP9930186.1 hypothetical protein [Cyanobium sp. AMD-g]
MYLLTIRDGLQTRHIGPYASPRQASDDLDKLQASCGEKATWQIHRLESPAELHVHVSGRGDTEPVAV